MRKICTCYHLIIYVSIRVLPGLDRVSLHVWHPGPSHALGYGCAGLDDGHLHFALVEERSFELASPAKSERVCALSLDVPAYWHCAGLVCSLGIQLTPAPSSLA
jgi:hypothetical protein